MFSKYTKLCKETTLLIAYYSYDVRLLEKIYQKSSLKEHILHRPDSYVGSLNRIIKNVWTYDRNLKKIVQKDMFITPAMFKIFDEILLNALDHKVRDGNMSVIKVDVNRSEGSVSIFNDGEGIPVFCHSKFNVYVPTLIFGHLLTSSNYDDTVDKLTGGRNGFGAKLCNLFSKTFILETSNKKSGLYFKQVWHDNMSHCDDPIIGSATENDFTKVTFYPDLSRMNMREFDDDLISLFERRAIDAAGCRNDLTVYFNDERIPISSFKEYVKMYCLDDNHEIVIKKFNNSWEIAVVLSCDNTFSQISFVNGIYMNQGGQHVKYICDQLVVKLIEIVNQSYPKLAIGLQPNQVKNCLNLFINCHIRNPTFDSQSKEYLSLAPTKFGSNCFIDNEYINNIVNIGFLNKMEDIFNKNNLSKSNVKRAAQSVQIQKLNDAVYAGTRNSRKCTLIVTEGDSAKSLAMAGLSEVESDFYGVYPLRGKLLNVRDVDIENVMANKELGNLVKILGLDYANLYETEESLNSLRYGKLLMLADQDPDGSHIKGLLINFFHYFWPNLLSHNFIEQFITPLIKAFHGTNVMSFYSSKDFDNWKTTAIPDYHKWRIKYYKGLGTSTSKEAKEYFSEMPKHRISLTYSDAEDEKIKMVFKKDNSNQRKDWILNWISKQESEHEIVENLYTDGVDSVTITDFIDKELIFFSNLSNERCTPSVMDGLKRSQRKVLFTCLKRYVAKEIKVIQLAGATAELTEYHHGENSLNRTIVGMAHDFVGSNNINLLEPIGQFGTRIHGGQDFAAPRYIFTKLSPVVKRIFMDEDELMLSYINECNRAVEPKWFAPVIPMILVNGSVGVGTGWNHSILKYNPIDVMTNIRRMLADQEPLEMMPWYKKFSGKILKLKEDTFVTIGVIKRMTAKQLEITELPVDVWTEKYKEDVLDPLVNKKKSFVKRYEDKSTDTTTRFIIYVDPDALKRLTDHDLEVVFRLRKNLKNHLVLFDDEGRIKQFESINEILYTFFKRRLELYEKRKDFLTNSFKVQIRKLENQNRFIHETNSRLICLENFDDDRLVRTLIERGYSTDPLKEWELLQNSYNSNGYYSDMESATKNGNVFSSNVDFGYLLSIPLRCFTKTNMEILQKNIQMRKNELMTIESKTARQIWLDDLDGLEKYIKH